MNTVKVSKAQNKPIRGFKDFMESLQMFEIQVADLPDVRYSVHCSDTNFSLLSNIGGVKLWITFFWPVDPDEFERPYSSDSFENQFGYIQLTVQKGVDNIHPVVKLWLDTALARYNQIRAEQHREPIERIDVVLPA